MLGTFTHTGWRYSSRQLCNCVIGGVVLARGSSDHLAVRLLIVLTSPHSYRSPVDRVTGLSAPAPRSGLSRSDFVLWPMTSDSALRRYFRNWGVSGHETSSRLASSAAARAAAPAAWRRPLALGAALSATRLGASGRRGDPRSLTAGDKRSVRGKSPTVVALRWLQCGQQIAMSMSSAHTPPPSRPQRMEPVIVECRRASLPSSELGRRQRLPAHGKKMLAYKAQ